jgi:hypothetical protein
VIRPGLPGRGIHERIAPQRQNRETMGEDDAMGIFRSDEKGVAQRGTKVGHCPCGPRGVAAHRQPEPSAGKASGGPGGPGFDAGSGTRDGDE